MDAWRDAWLSEKRMTIAGLREWDASLTGRHADLTHAAVELVIDRVRRPAGRSGLAVGAGGRRAGRVLARPGTDARLRRLQPRRARRCCRSSRPCWAAAASPIWSSSCQRLDHGTVELVLAAFTQASRWQRDVALYAFGGDPWAVSGLDRRADAPAYAACTRLRIGGRRDRARDAARRTTSPAASRSRPSWSRWRRRRCWCRWTRAAATRSSTTTRTDGPRFPRVDGQVDQAPAGRPPAAPRPVLPALGEVVADVRRRRQLVAAPRRPRDRLPRHPGAGVLAAAARPLTDRCGPAAGGVVALVDRPGRPRGPVRR